MKCIFFIKYIFMVIFYSSFLLSVANANTLFDATENGDIELMKNLISGGTDINTKYVNNWTSLMVAAQTGNIRAIQVLLDNGADIHAVDSYGETALIFSSWHGHEKATKLLLNHKANVNDKDKDGWTPLMWAARYNRIEVIEILLSHGADKSAKDKLDRTALMLAKHFKAKEAVELLMGNNSNRKTAKSLGNSTLPCDAEGVTQTGKQYQIIGVGHHVRIGPSKEYERVKHPNHDIFITMNSDLTILEQCTSGEWSYVNTVSPSNLTDIYKGWILTNILDKGQILADPYAQKLSSIALSPYTEKSYPDTVKEYKSRLKEIEELRRDAAEIVLDTEMCSYIEQVDLSTSSTIKHLKFFIDCKDYLKRVRLDEFEIKKLKTKLNTEKHSK